MKRDRKVTAATTGPSSASTGRDGAIDFVSKSELLSRSAEDNLDDHIYRVIELVGTSENSIEDAVKSAIERAHKTERRSIPHDFPFDRVPGLSREVVQRLSQVRPDTLGHALRIPGVTPAAVAVLCSYVGRQLADTVGPRQP